MCFKSSIWETQCQNVPSGRCGQQRPRSACASAQSDQGLQFPLTESLDTTECMNEFIGSRSYVAHAEDDLNLRILLVFEGTISLGAAHISLLVNLR